MDSDELMAEDIIDALEDVDDAELIEIQNAVAREIASRNDDGLDMDEDDEEFDDEDEDE